jgi:hypothetical protein
VRACRVWVLAQHLRAVGLRQQAPHQTVAAGSAAVAPRRPWLFVPAPRAAMMMVSTECLSGPRARTPHSGAPKPPASTCIIAVGCSAVVASSSPWHSGAIRKQGPFAVACPESERPNRDKGQVDLPLACI